MKYIIEFNKHDLEGRYMDNADCPIHRAMRRAGVPVKYVGGYEFSTTDGEFHRFDAELQAAANVLSNSKADRSKLLGRQFSVDTGTPRT